MSKLKGTIKNWGIIPRSGAHVIVGDMEIHMLGMKSSTPVTTSALVKLYSDDGTIYAETKNSIYTLKRLDPSFQKTLDIMGKSLNEYLEEIL